MVSAPRVPPVSSSPINDPKGWAVGLTQRLLHATEGKPTNEIAERTGTPLRAVERYLAGTEPSPLFLARFCEEYGVDIGWLLLGTVAPPSG